MHAKIRDQAVKLLSAKVYHGFGAVAGQQAPCEEARHEVNRETLRNWMQAAGLWTGSRRRTGNVHASRQRRSRCGELVQWDTNDHD